MSYPPTSSQQLSAPAAPARRTPPVPPLETARAPTQLPTQGRPTSPALLQTLICPQMAAHSLTYAPAYPASYGPGSPTFFRSGTSSLYPAQPPTTAARPPVLAASQGVLHQATPPRPPSRRTLTRRGPRPVTRVKHRGRDGRHVPRPARTDPIPAPPGAAPRVQPAALPGPSPPPADAAFPAFAASLPTIETLQAALLLLGRRPRRLPLHPRRPVARRPHRLSARASPSPPPRAPISSARRTSASRPRSTSWATCMNMLSRRARMTRY
ncbi:hypothetical protein JB92DRAFT_3107006 [Gautieria morchelliformis]|nr:hypothetical protein JB92DRAFT_3107006 [Gautieria morchelliformis]